MVRGLDESRLDVYISDDVINMTKTNRGDIKSLLFTTNEYNNRIFVEFIDLILHPGKRNLYVHDMRTRDVYSSVSFAIEMDNVSLDGEPSVKLVSEKKVGEV